MIISQALPTDAQAIASLINLAMLEITYQFIGKENAIEADNFIAHFVAQPNNQYSYENIYVIKDNNQILGQISIYDGSDLIRLRQPILDKIYKDYGRKYLPTAETQAGEIYIDTFAVHPEAQGKGIGKLLMNFVIQKVVHEDGKILGLLVDNDNPDAKRLYEKIGFKVIKTTQVFNKTMDHMQYHPQ